MKLRFYARSNLLVSRPGQRLVVGSFPRYVGRKADGRGGFPATKEPHECDADSAAGRRLASLCRSEASLWPADEATAAHCGVEFVPTRFDDGEHVKAEVQPKPAAGKSASKKGD